MESKVIIFLALASLAQGADVLSSGQVSYGLTKDQIAVVKSILDKYDNTTKLQFNGWNDYFELFVTPTDFPADGPAELSSILTKLSGTGAGVYEAATAVFGQSCTAIQKGRAQVTPYLSDVVKQIAASVKLARFNSYSKNKNAIEKSRAAVLKDFTEGVKVFFASILACENSKDEKVVALIAETEAASIAALGHLTNAIYDVIVLRASSTAADVQKLKYTIKVKHFESRARYGAKTDRDVRYALVIASYVAKQLNETGILPELYTIQYAFLGSRVGYYPRAQ